jgi:flagellar biosynthesis/type III secretory pathway chaperone
MNNGDIRSFVASLEAERVAFQEFVELLKSEEKTLLDGDIDRLAALAQVKRLLELAKAAQQLNQSNGAMIQQRLVNNQKALAVLQATANHASLYGPDGQTRTSNTGRPLGEG